MPTCIAIENPIFKPAMRIITAITNANPMQVTTSFAHNYISGTIVRLDIPFVDGMQQANQLFGPINVTAPTTFTIPIDSINFDVFTNNDCAQAVPIGEVNEILTAAVQNVLPY